MLVTSPLTMTQTHACDVTTHHNTNTWLTLAPQQAFAYLVSKGTITPTCTSSWSTVIGQLADSVSKVCVTCFCHVILMTAGSLWHAGTPSLLTKAYLSLLILCMWNIEWLAFFAVPDEWLINRSAAIWSLLKISLRRKLFEDSQHYHLICGKCRLGGFILFKITTTTFIRMNMEMKYHHRHKISLSWIFQYYFKLQNLSSKP
jgi:hypothetical protein